MPKILFNNKFADIFKHVLYLKKGIEDHSSKINISPHMLTVHKSYVILCKKFSSEHGKVFAHTKNKLKCFKSVA